jgi:hypothetical protein
MVGHNPDRRQFLRAGAGLAAVGTAGCLGGAPGDDTPTPSETSDDTPARTETDEPTGRAGDAPIRSLSCNDGSTPAAVDVPSAPGGTVAGDLDLAIDRARLVESVIVGGVFNSLKQEPGTQYLELAIESGSQAIAELETSLVVDGTERTSRFPRTSSSRILGEGDIALPVPVSGASDATVRFETGDGEAAWTVPSELVSRFDSAPVFSVRLAEMVPCESPTLGLVVENTGVRDGVFRALARPEGPGDVSYPATVGVPEDETTRRTVEVVWFDDGRGRELIEWSANDREFRYR